MKPGDIVRKENPISGIDLFWEVEGVFLGAVGQENLVRLRSLSQRAGSLGELTQTCTIVPEALLQGRVYARRW